MRLYSSGCEFADASSREMDGYAVAARPWAGQLSVPVEMGRPNKKRIGRLPSRFLFTLSVLSLSLTLFVLVQRQVGFWTSSASQFYTE